MTKVRISSVPMQGGGSTTKKVRISKVPMQNGGTDNNGENYVPSGQGEYAEQQPGHGYALNRSWGTTAGYPGVDPKTNPFGKVGNVLPESQDGGDINAEKQERVLGDFDQDGSLELMNVGGKPHTEGGKDVDVPSNSFVFSDTKDLRIKDPNVLAMFNMAPKRSGYTPAEIAKKYDLNKYKGVLDNPDSDDLSLHTAQIMTDNYMAKLNKLAMIQEQMKKSMGMKNSIDDMAVQQQPNMQPQAPMQQPPMQRGGRYLPSSVPLQEPVETVVSTGQNNIVGGNEWMYGQQPWMYPMPPYKGVKGTDYSEQELQSKFKGAGWDGYQQPGRWAQKAYPEQVAATMKQEGDAHDTTPDVPFGPHYIGKRYGVFADMLPEPEPDAPKAMMPPVNTTDNTGDPTQDLVPYAPTSGPLAGEGKTQDVVDNKSKKAHVGWNLGVDPNLMGNAMNLLQMAQLRRFVPYEPVPQAVIPDTVFMDPTRALAATQEEARNAQEYDQGPVGRANFLARQGVAGRQAADIVGQYHNQNVALANQANAQAANITNELMGKQASRLAELNKAGFLSDRDYQREMGRLQAEWVDRFQKQHDNAVKTEWLNKTSPYFGINPVTQMPYFKSDVAKAKYEQMYANDGTITNDEFARRAQLAKRYKEELVKNGFSQDEAERLASGNAGLREHESSTYKGLSSVPANRKMSGLPADLDTYKNGGAYLPHYDIGGDFISMGAGPEPSLAGFGRNQRSVPEGGSSQPLEINNNVKVKADAYNAYDYYLNKGIPNHIAAGIVGNLYQESGINPGAVNKKSGAFGVAQWNGPRKDNFMNWANSNGRNPNDLYTQLDYVLQEPGESTKMWTALSGTNNPVDAAMTFANVYERMGKDEANYKKRASVANKLFNSDFDKILQQRGVFQNGGSPLQNLSKFIS